MSDAYLLQMRKGKDDPLYKLVDECLSNKKDLIGIQIGSYSGESTEIFLSSNAFKILYCIDPYEPMYDPNDGTSYSDLVTAQNNFKNKFKDNKIIQKIKMKSADAVNRFEDDSIDFIYIDGCHTYESTKLDIKNYFPKVKKGGIIAGHDYEWVNVKKVVNEYFNKELLKLYPDQSWVYIKE